MVAVTYYCISFLEKLVFFVVPKIPIKAEWCFEWLLTTRGGLWGRLSLIYLNTPGYDHHVSVDFFACLSPWDWESKFNDKSRFLLSPFFSSKEPSNDQVRFMSSCGFINIWTEQYIIRYTECPRKNLTVKKCDIWKICRNIFSIIFS